MISSELIAGDLGGLFEQPKQRTSSSTQSEEIKRIEHLKGCLKHLQSTWDPVESRSLKNQQIVAILKLQIISNMITYFFPKLAKKGTFEGNPKDLNKTIRDFLPSRSHAQMFIQCHEIYNDLNIIDKETLKENLVMNKLALWIHEALDTIDVFASSANDFNRTVLPQIRAILSPDYLIPEKEKETMVLTGFELSKDSIISSTRQQSLSKSTDESSTTRFKNNIT